MKKETFDRIVDNNYKFLSEPLKCIGFNHFEQTLWKGKRSDKSLSFKGGELDKLFGINEQGEFGQNKKKLSELDSRIYTVHSSALLALQIFNWVREGNSIEIDKIKYNRVLFEVKNKCATDQNPSCIDVLLVSENENTLLFLESKFTEYLEGETCEGIDDKYRLFFNLLNLFDSKEGKLKMSRSYRNKDCRFVFDLESTKKSAIHYCEGIKQMICHYIGLLRGPQEKEGVYRSLFDRAEQLILGEIAFKFDDKQSEYKDYFQLYHSLAEKLKAVSFPTGKKISVLENILTYQDLIESNKDYKLGDKDIEENIKNFYHL